MTNNSQVSTEKGQILIVDDVPNNLRLLSKLLNHHGYQVRKAISGQLALKGAQLAKPDLILLDINMPDMDGYEICREFKKNQITSNIPVIFISVSDKIIDKVKAFEVGGADYITKPCQIEEVLVRIENQLNQTRLSQHIQKQNNKLQTAIAKRQCFEKEIDFLLTTTRVIGKAEDLHSVLEKILSYCCEMMNWALGEAWVKNSETNSLVCSHSWSDSSSGLEKFREETLQVRFSPGVGLPGRVWLTKQPEWIEDVSVEPEQVFLRHQVATAAGLKAGFGIPIFLDGEVLTVLVFFKKETEIIQKHLIDLVSTVGTQLSLMLRCQQLEKALRDSKN